MLKATAWIPGKLEDPAVILRHLEGFNPSLKTASWCIVRHERSQEANASGGLNHLLLPSRPDYLKGKESRAGGAYHGNGEARAVLNGCTRIHDTRNKDTIRGLEGAGMCC